MPLYNIWGQTIPNQPDSVGAYCLGHMFQSSVAGNVVGVRFYKSANDTGTHVGSLWSSTGSTHYASITFTGETASGWQSMNFSSPVPILAATNYMVTVTHSVRYSNNSNCPAYSGIYTPLSSNGTAGGYIAGSADAFPTTINQPFWEGVDVIFDDLGHLVLPPMISGKPGRQGVVGYMKGISLGGPTAYYGDTTFLRHLQVGMRKENSDGSPSAPCIALDIPGMWRFRWGVKSGARTISINAKQVSNVTGKRPKLVVKANSAIGVLADVSGIAGSGTGWVTIGPLSVSPSSDGVLWVELWNMDTDNFNSPAFFDHISVS